MILTMAEPEIAPAAPHQSLLLPDPGRKYQSPAMEGSIVFFQLRDQMIEG